MSVEFKLKLLRTIKVWAGEVEWVDNAMKRVAVQREEEAYQQWQRDSATGRCVHQRDCADFTPVK